MKLIVAVVRPERLEAVKEALAEVEVFRLTVADVDGLERVADRGAPELARRAKLEIAVNEAFLEPALAAIVGAARTGDHGQAGDGHVLVSPLTDVVRIRTGERGSDAI